MVVQLCVGVVYLWSALEGTITAAYSAGLENTAGIGRGAAMVPAVMLLALVCGSLIGSMLSRRMGPKLPGMIGIVLFAAGTALSGLVKSMGLLDLTYGLLAGLGAGIAYGASIFCILKWLPQRIGMAAGLSCSGFGLSAVILAPIAQLLMNANRGDDGIVSLRPVFLILALILLVLGLAACLFLSLPDNQYDKTLRHARSVYDPNAALPQLVNMPPFWCLCLSILCLGGVWCVAFPQIHQLGTDRGLTAGMVLTCVILAGIANTAGRVVMGWFSDQLGRFPALYLLCGVTLACSLLLTFIGGYGYFITVVLLAFVFGGVIAVHSALCTELFGRKHAALNYAAALLPLGLGAVIFGLVSQYLFRGNAIASYLTTAVLAVVSAVLLLRLSRYQALQKAQRK